MKSRVGRRRGSGWDKSYRTAGEAGLPACLVSQAGQEACPTGRGAQQLVHHHAAGGRDIERVLAPQHGDADVGVGEPGNLRPDTIHFVAEDQAHWEARAPLEQVHGVHGGLHGGDFATPAARRFEQPKGIPVMFPGNRQLRSQRGLRDRLFRRTPGDPGEVQLHDPGRIGRSEERSHVVQTADVVEQNRNRQPPQAIVKRPGPGDLEWETVQRP
jgi:hypothetical protein